MKESRRMFWVRQLVNFLQILGFIGIFVGIIVAGGENTKTGIAMVVIGLISTTIGFIVYLRAPYKSDGRDIGVTVNR